MARYPDVQYIRCRTDGNAARKVEVVAPIKTLRLPRVRKLKPAVVRVDPLALTAIVMVVIMASLMIIGAVQLDSAQKETVTMKAYVETLQQENEVLHTEFRDKCKLDEIERTALALGMVPQEQVTHVRVSVPQEIPEEEVGAWEQFTMFLASLFA